MAETNKFDYLPVSKLRSTNEPQFRDDLGAFYHFNQYERPVPVFVITDLDGNILCGNNTIKPVDNTKTKADLEKQLDGLKKAAENTTIEPGSFTDKEIKRLEDLIKNTSTDTYTNEWLISGVKTTVTRFFSCSTATVMLTCDISDQSMPTPLLPEDLQIERDICIWGGFINSIRPVIQEDLRYNLLRGFVGIIDTIQFTGSGTGGHTISISCRDRLKWLMDTSNTFDIGSIQGDTIDRSDLILKIAQKGIGFIPQIIDLTKPDETITSNNDPKKRIITPGEAEYMVDLSKNNKTNSIKGVTEVPSFENIYLSNPLSEKKDGLLSGGDPSQIPNLKVEKDPKFYIYTTRVGISTQNTAQLMIRQQHPIDMIKTLTMQEVYPTDMFQSHVDGNFYYYPRAADYNSLNSASRYFRTYFFRTVPSLIDKDLLSYPNNKIEPTEEIPWKVTEEGNFVLIKDLGEISTNIPEGIKLAKDVESIERLTTSKSTVYEGNDTIFENGIVPNAQGTRNFAFNDTLTLTLYLGNKDAYGIDLIVNIQDKIYLPVKSTTDKTKQASVQFTFNRNMVTEEEFRDYFVDKLIDVQAFSILDSTSDSSIYKGAFSISLVKQSLALEKQKQKQEQAKNQIPLLPPDPNQMMISLRYEESSIGVFTNFILYKSNTHDQLVTTEWTMHLELMPDAFYGRDGNQIPIANKFVRIEDPNVKSPAEGVAVLLNAARVYARATQVVSMVINGDPSVTPGEIFQIFGSPVLDNNGLPDLIRDRENYLKMKTLSITSFQSLAIACSVTNKENATPTEESSNINLNLLNTPNVSSNLTPTTYGQLSDADKEKYIQVNYYNGAVIIAGLDNGKSGDKAVTSDDILTKTSNKVFRKPEDIIPEPKTIFRVEAVSHKFNIGGSKGFTTEVSLTTAF
jgi:hypothetical protein